MRIRINSSICRMAANDVLVKIHFLFEAKLIEIIKRFIKEEDRIDSQLKALRLAYINEWARREKGEEKMLDLNLGSAHKNSDP